MKTKSVILFASIGLLSGLMSCSPTGRNASPITLSLDSLKARYGPDERIAVFDIACTQQGSITVVKGEVDNPKAKEDVLITVRRKLGGEVLDSVKVLPDPQFGEKRFGIVAVSVGNVRGNPRHPAELVTQAMMGMVVKLLKKQGVWYYVQLPDKYLGWLEESAMKVTTEAGVDAWKSAPKVIATTHFTMVREQPNAASLPVRDAVAGALMKQIRATGPWVAVELPDGCAGYIEKSNVDEYGHWKKTRKLIGENIERTAKTFLGVPYLWGGTSPKGMDCSGFTKIVYRLNGLELLRDADQQAVGGEDVKAGEDFENFRKGDLLFFGRKGTPDKPERITHTGIYLEKKEYIHSSAGGAWVSINSFDPSASNYREDLRKSFVRARRYVGTQQVPEVAEK